jgi:DNA transformation protein and related proteins
MWYQHQACEVRAAFDHRPAMDDAEIEEMFSGLGAVSIRRMFGGKGVYHRGLIVAVQLHGEILLKADEVSAPAFEAAGATRWTYEGRQGKRTLMPYWSIPDEAMDDPDLLAGWTRLAYEAALRSSKA